MDTKESYAQSSREQARDLENHLLKILQNKKINVILISLPDQNLKRIICKLEEKYDIKLITMKQTFLCMKM